MEALVTIATFDFPAEAEVVKLLLEQNDIKVFMADNNLVGMDWFVSNAVGGVKIQVVASDVDQAKSILDNYKTSVEQQQLEKTLSENITFNCETCGKTILFPAKRRGGVETCPHCGEYVDVPDENEIS